MSGVPSGFKMRPWYVIPEFAADATVNGVTKSAAINSIDLKIVEQNKVRTHRFYRRDRLYS